LRRFSAIVVLAVVSFWLVSPALTADSGTNVPACCRKTGKHQCAMDGDTSSGQALSSIRCGSFPVSVTTLKGAGAFLAAVLLSIVAAFLVRPLDAPPARTAGLLSLLGAHYTRGPPACPSFA
jgi:hypothetical protein